MTDRRAALVVGCVLAGGLARRMGGGDKGMIEVGGRPILATVIERLAPQVSLVILNANGDPARFAAFGLPVVADTAPGYAGPLAGVLAAMRWAQVHAPGAIWVATAATDTPFFPPDVVARLIDAVQDQGGDLACAASGGRRHPVFGLWPVRLADDLERAMTVEGVRKVDAFTGRHRLAVAEFAAEPADPFFNVNSPEDVAEAARIGGRLLSCGRKVIGVAGFKNAGKTTLVERLVRELAGRGYRVSTVKHAHHSFDVDHEGRDSFRHRKAGASEVAVVSMHRWAIIHENRSDDREPPLADILDRLSPCDLVIVEGYKRDSHPKIEVRDVTLDHSPLAGDDPTVIALAASAAVDAPVPVFARDDIAAIADFVIARMELRR